MKLKNTLEKYLSKKNLVILLIIGVIFMVVPEFQSKEDNSQVQIVESIEKIDKEELEKTLMKIRGVNSVNIFLSYRDSGSKNYAYDIKNDENKQELEIKMSDEMPIITNTTHPKIEGILVVVEGENLNEADFSCMVKAATGVPLHRICVKISKGD